MSSRLSSTEKWNDAWFNSLSPNAKLLFFYLVENCDNAGFYEINKKFLMFFTGLDNDNLVNAISELKKAYIKSNDGLRIWIINFLKYQKKTPLNFANNNHKQIISIIQYNLTDENKFKGCAKLNAILPIDLQIAKRKKKETPAYNYTLALATEVPSEDFLNSTNGELPKVEITREVIIATPRMKKPTIDEISEYMKEKDFEYYVAESSRFFNYFESKAWMVGNSPMKSWKSAVHTWLKHFYERNKMHEKKSKLSVIQEAHEELSGVDWNEVYKTENNE